MEKRGRGIMPFKTHDATLPQQDLTHPAGGCPPGLRPVDSMPGEHEGANPPAGQREALCQVVDHATTTTLQPPGVSANTRGDDCESSSSGTKVLTRLKAFELFKGNTRNLPVDERINIVLNYFGPDFELSYTEEKFKGILAAFLCKSHDLLKQCKGNKPYFMKKHSVWLSGTLISGQSKKQNDETETLSPESKKFKALSRAQQYRCKRRLQETLDDNPSSIKIQAFVKTLKINENPLPHTSAKSLETIINLCLASETASVDILKKIQQSSKQYTPEEALSIFIDRNLTVQTYNDFHLDHKNLGSDIYPPYYKLLEAKKLCYPDQIQISESEASVPVKELVQHTLSRILQLTDEVFNNYCENKDIQTIECNFIGNWGFDGSTGQSLYKQSFSGTEVDENSMFATTLVPLQIITNDGNVIFWMNPSPQSYRFCRPIHIQYRKESSELVLNEKQIIQEQIDNLTPFLSETSKGYRIKVNCKLVCAAIDGKILNMLLNSSSQLRCPYCNLTSKKFNDIATAFSVPIVDESLLVYGVSPLHFWIRCLEFVLKLGYKVEIKKWRVTKNSNEGRLLEERKQKIQAEIREKMGLLVDVVRPTSGTTNDGNTARTAFSDRHRGTFAEILNIDKWLLDDLYIISTVLSTNLPVDTEKFSAYCKNLAYKYVEKYAWHPMTVTIHKILVHGAQIIESSLLPVGMLSEQAAESRNKFWRFDREHHTRKISREATVSDLFHRALESSDPVISDYTSKKRKQHTKKNPLPALAVSLLKPLDLTVVSTTTSHEDDDNLVIPNESTD